MLTASGSPNATRPTSPAVHGPIPGIALELPAGLGRIEPGEGLEPAAPTPPIRAEQLRPAALQSEWMEGVVGQAGEALGRRTQAQPERPGRRLAVVPDRARGRPGEPRRR